MKFKQVAATAADIQGQRRRYPTPAEMSAIAALHRKLVTKKHARLVLRHNGFSGSGKLVDALLHRISTIEWERRRRATSRIEMRLSTVPQWAIHRLRSEAPLSNSVSTLQHRLERLRKNTVLAVAKSCLRHGAAGGSSFKVRLTKNPAEVGYTVTMDSNRDTYRGYYKGWAAAEDHHVITVPADWRVRVLRRGLATVGGMLTLDLQPLVGHGDIELFQAVWVSQARGFGVSVHRGVMARLGDQVFHAPSLQEASRGHSQAQAGELARSRTGQRLPAHRRRLRGSLRTLRARPCHCRRCTRHGSLRVRDSIVVSCRRYRPSGRFSAAVPCADWLPSSAAGRGAANRAARHQGSATQSELSGQQDP